MDEPRFRTLAAEQGYGDFQSKAYAPDNDGALHAHEFSVMLLVLEGDFRLAFADRVTPYAPGEVCELHAGILHMERTGSAGARILLSKRAVIAPPAG